jgi:hypothetical protein
MSDLFALPRYIAFCGVPKSGKSLAQAIMLNNYAVEIVDDGAILREFAMKNLGASHDQVHTQEGKAAMAFWPNGEPMIDARTGELMTWRRVLGLLGNQLEAMFGKHVMPMTACARIAAHSGSFSFGSVRRDQGQYYKDNGGIVIEIVNPLAVPTGNEFDEYDASIVDYSIMNDALALGMSHFDGYRNLSDKIHQIVLAHGSHTRLAA